MTGRDKARRVVLVIAVLVVVAMVLYPPWKRTRWGSAPKNDMWLEFPVEGRYAPLWAPPSGPVLTRGTAAAGTRAELDTPRLLVQCVPVALLAGLGLLLLRD